MPIRDILLQTTSYPEHTPHWALDAAAWLAEQFGARLSSALCQVYIPEVSNWLADMLVQANEAIAAENAKSRNNAKHLITEFASLVKESYRGEQFLIDCKSMIFPGEVAKHARSFDLTIIPVDSGLDYRFMAEGVIFDSGRPVLLLPRAGGAGHPLDEVVIGWDGSRAAARALADALPICLTAKGVRLLQVTGEKDIDPIVSLTEARRHLTSHGIEASIAKVAAAGRDAGAVLMDHCASTGADLLVMGAFGHSRAREFVLGGATRSVLDDVRIPVLLSH